jgi:predicted  nucleic acid-binding Zn-ribbon protein
LLKIVTEDLHLINLKSLTNNSLLLFSELDSEEDSQERSNTSIPDSLTNAENQREQFNQDKNPPQSKHI